MRHALPSLARSQAEVGHLMRFQLDQFISIVKLYNQPIAIQTRYDPTRPTMIDVLYLYPITWLRLHWIKDTVINCNKLIKPKITDCRQPSRAEATSNSLETKRAILHLFPP
jgi:hypothetical protein